MRRTVIRPYAPRDRSAVRRIACETADLGEPLDGLLQDRQLLADLLTRYYTDCEPALSWVAEYKGRVVGYVTGCADTRRYWRLFGSRVMPAALLGAVVRGVMWRRAFWRYAAAALRTGWHGWKGRWAVVSRFPAHVHINLEKNFRRQRIGRQLLEQAISRLQQRRVAGVHAAVRGDNVAGSRFFQQMGFAEVARQLTVWAVPDGRAIRQTVLYGKRLNP